MQIPLYEGRSTSSYTDLKLAGGLSENTGVVRAGSSQVLWHPVTMVHSWNGSCGVSGISNMSGSVGPVPVSDTEGTASFLHHTDFV